MLNLMSFMFGNKNNAWCAICSCIQWCKPEPYVKMLTYWVYWINVIWIFAALLFTKVTAYVWLHKDSAIYTDEEKAQKM